MKRYRYLPCFHKVTILYSKFPHCLLLFAIETGDLLDSVKKRDAPMTSLLIFPHIRFLFFFLGLFGLILRADSTDDRFSLILQMMERNILRLLHISFTDGFYQLFMLTDQKISCLLLLQILYTICLLYTSRCV